MTFTVDTKRIRILPATGKEQRTAMQTILEIEQEIEMRKIMDAQDQIREMRKGSKEDI